MSGGRALAEHVSGRLGFRCVSREDLVGIVDAQGECARKVVDTIARATRAYDQFSRLRRAYIVFMRFALLRLIRDGPIVYHGHSGHLLLPRLPCCLRVRINAPMSMRVENARERLGLPSDEAREAVLLEDEERVRWGRYLYGRDIRDPDLYDTCFSLQRLTLDTISAMVVAALAEPEFRPRAEIRAAVEELYLATAVEAALAASPSTESLEVGARATGGRVHIEGPWLDEASRREVLSIARDVTGVTEVEYEPGCASAFEVVT
jgi:hypothetical protein